MNGSELAPLLEYTALAPLVGAARVTRMCEEARAGGFAAVCVNPVHVARASRLLDGCDVHVCAVVGYPLGSLTTRQKAYEAATALEDGALEIDMSLDLAALQAGGADSVRADIYGVADVVSRNPYAVLKVDLEIALLTEAQRHLAVRMAIEGGAHYVVASRGFGDSSPLAADVEELRGVASDLIGVKATGVRDSAGARELLAAGATRLGSEEPATLVQGIGRRV